MAGWAGHKLDIMWSGSEKKGKTYVRTMLKTVNFLLKKGASSGDHYMKEEGIVDMIKFNASLTLSKEERAAMSRLVKNKSPSCFIYDL